MIVVDSEVKLDYSDVLLVPRESSVNSRSKVNLEIDFYQLGDVVPLIAANMDYVGTFKMAEELSKDKILTCLNKHYELDDLLQHYQNPYAKYSIYSLGTNKEDLNKFYEFVDQYDGSNLLAVCLDVANAYTSQFQDTIAKLMENFPEYVWIAGNVVTPEITERLIDLGVDIVKIGIGPGSVCTTRKIAGVGYPQFSAVLECSAAARGAGGKIIADGGCNTPGDVAKAFGAGADFVMLGGMLAGHQEGYSRAELALENLEHTLPFHGMASKKAQQIHGGGLAEYRASEGKEVKIKFKGPVKNTVLEVLGGLRSAATYVGVDNIADLPKRAKFVKVNRQLNNVFGL